MTPGQRDNYSDPMSVTQHDSTRRDPDHSTTFIQSMGQAVHRWFRYSAGFSAEWAERTIADHAERHDGQLNVLDPFAGSGTTVLAAQAVGCPAIGVESHPFVSRVAKAKLLWDTDVEAFTSRADAILAEAEPVESNEVPALLAKCYEPDALSWLRGMLQEVEAQRDGSPVDELIWLAFVAILRVSSHVGTAQWQYVLPNRRKARVLSPVDAFEIQVATMAEDMRLLQQTIGPHDAEIFAEDARGCPSVPTGWADLIVTSPPYANNYDYADATRLEMTVLGEVQSWGELAWVRDHLIHSCTQHMAHYDVQAALDDPGVSVIRDELANVVDKLGEVKLTKKGRKAYDAMVAAYFKDLADVWAALRRVTRQGGEVCFVVGDSAPYGVHVPVESWLGDIAVAAGFESWTFEKIRDRNVKWKNRKHNVPLHEGRLWVRG